ncbi:hypothetical protein CCACVL1_19244, partial [Corchorus capsularis]
NEGKFLKQGRAHLEDNSLAA